MAFVELARSLLSCVLHVYEPVDALAEGDTSLGGRHGCGALAYALVPTRAASGESGARQERAFWGRRWERRPGGTPANCHVIRMHASVGREIAISKRVGRGGGNVLHAAYGRLVCPLHSACPTGRIIAVTRL